VLSMSHVWNVDETQLEALMQQACMMLHMCTEEEECPRLNKPRMSKPCR